MMIGLLSVKRTSRRVLRPAKGKRQKKTAAKGKPLFNKEKELQRSIAQIQKLEEEQEELYALLSDAALYKKDPEEVARVQIRSESVEDELFKAY